MKRWIAEPIPEGPFSRFDINETPPPDKTTDKQGIGRGGEPSAEKGASKLAEKLGPGSAIFLKAVVYQI